MIKNKKIEGSMIGASLALVMCTASALEVKGELVVEHVSAYTPAASVSSSLEEKLSDELHTKTATLEAADAIHYYSFSAVRGQKVLLGDSVQHDGPVFFEIEYLEGGEWKKKIESSKVFSGLEPGAEIKIRVSHKKDQPYSQRPYTFVFGSSPVLKEYQLKDQYRMKRIPSGYTQPSFLPVQGSIEAQLEASFTDSVGSPLKGAIGLFEMKLSESRMRPVVVWVVSDAAGQVSKTVSFERCYGGRETADIEIFYGPGTWRSYYYVGTYRLENAYPDRLAQTAEQEGDRVFGHVCGHRKVRR